MRSVGWTENPCCHREKIADGADFRVRGAPLRADRPGHSELNGPPGSDVPCRADIVMTDPEEG